jgi:hypothetical protein
MDERSFAMIAVALPEGSRYRGLLRRVLDWLPNGWAEFQTFGVVLEAGKPLGYATALPYRAVESPDGDEATHSESTWVVTLYPEWLDPLSDQAVMWVIAHELGHVASGCPCGIVSADGRRVARLWGTVDTYREVGDLEIEVNEGTADAIARDWGFHQEEAAFRQAVLDCG